MPLKRNIYVAVGVGLMGLLVNLLPYTVRENVQMVFGGVFPALVALALGPGWGAVAAVVAYAPTLWMWGHGFGLLSAVLETVLVGEVGRRFQSGRWADAVFWVAFWVPLLMTPVYFAMPQNQVNVWAMVLKGPVNSLLNVSLALLALTFLPRGKWTSGLLEESPQRPLRHVLISGFVVAAVTPLMLVVVAYGHKQEREQVEQVSERLSRKAENLAAQLDQYVETHKAAILGAAATKELTEVGSEELLARTAAVYPGFLTLLEANAQGELQAAYPLFTATGMPTLRTGTSIAEREYFREPMRTGEAYVSGAFRGRGFGNDPIVAVSAPLQSAVGVRNGIIEGSLNLERFARRAEQMVKEERISTILMDRERKTIFASANMGLESLADVEAEMASGKGDVIQWKPAQGDAFIARHRMATGWKVVLLEPQAHFLHGMELYYRRMALWTLMAVLFSITMVRVVAGTVTRPLESIVQHLRSVQMDSPQAVSIEAPASAPAEVHELARDLGMLSTGFVQSYQGLQESLDERMRLNEELTRLLLQLKQKATELSRAKGQAEEASRAKTAFLTNISHEIRTPLNGLLGMLTILMDSKLSEEQLKRAQLAFSSAESLLALMNGLLHLSHGDGANSEVEKVQFAPAAVIEGMVSGYERRATERQLQLTSYVDPRAKATFTGDPGKIRQVLTHLLDNAFKFTHRGSVRVAVLVKEETKQGTMCRFEVSDTGVGIAAEAQSRLFEPFAQADPSLTRRHGGTGIGLALCRRIVDRLGGKIGMQSQQGIGSMFWFQVPLETATRVKVEEERRPKERPAEAGVSKGQEEAVPRRGKILIVEDNAVNQKVASRLVQTAGFETDVVGNGQLAVEAVLKTEYLAILMDCQMPVMDGYQATIEIRKMEGEGKRIPVIAVTAHAMEGDRDRCLAAGMDDYLTKPINKAQLMVTLEKWLSAREEPKAINVSE